MKRFKLPLIALVVIIAIAAVCLIMAPMKGYAASGREAKEMYSQYQSRISEDNDETEEETSSDLPFWFSAPKGFLEGKTDDKKYVSKINPFDTPDEWDALGDIVAKREASQMPEELLSNTSTDELVLYCLNYNLYFEALLFDTMDKGIENLKEDFNGCRELLSRDDCADSLIRLYSLYDLDEQAENDGFCTIRFKLLNALLWQPEVLDRLSAEQAKTLGAASAKKVASIINSQNSPYSPSAAAYLAVASQYHSDEDFASIINASSGAKRYVETEMLVLDEITDETLGKVKSYFSKLR